MKLQCLSVLVAAMMIANSTGAAELYNKDGNKLDLYGKFTGMRYISKDDDKNGDRSLIIYGFHGETQLSDEITGFATWKNQLILNPPENQHMHNPSTLLSFIGIKFNEIGSIDYGKNYGILYDIGAWTNVIPKFADDTPIANNFLSVRANNVVTYRNKDFFGMIDGLNFAVQYQSKNNSKENNATVVGLQEANGNGYGVSVTYDLGNGISTGAAINRSNRTQSQQSFTVSHNQDKKAEAYTFGLKYDADNLYLAALYSETFNMTPYGNFFNSLHGFAETAHNIEFVAQYQFDFGLRPSLGYIQSRIDDHQDGKRHDIKKSFELGARYDFNKNMITFINYRINLLSKDKFISATNTSTDNIIALGMTYMF